MSCLVQYHYCFLYDDLSAFAEVTIQYFKFPGMTDKKKQTALNTAAG